MFAFFMFGSPFDASLLEPGARSDLAPLVVLFRSLPYSLMTWGEVHVVAERAICRLDVGRQSIRTDLQAIRQPVAGRSSINAIAACPSRSPLGTRGLSWTRHRSR